MGNDVMMEGIYPPNYFFFLELSGSSSQRMKML